MARTSKTDKRSEDDAVGETLLLRFDPEAAKAAPDGDPNYEFQIAGADGERLRYVNGIHTDGDRAFVWPHDSEEARDFKARGYRREKYASDGVRPMGVDALEATDGEDIRVRDHVCMSIHLDKWKAYKSAELARGNASVAQMRKSEEAPIRL
jgi:hypothetical protein